MVEGVVYGRVRGVDVPRHYGDPAAEYEAARKGLAIRDRSHRSRLLVRGRAPVAALQGVLTGRMPRAPPAPKGSPSRSRSTTNFRLQIQYSDFSPPPPSPRARGLFNYR